MDYPRNEVHINGVIYNLSIEGIIKETGISKDRLIIGLIIFNSLCTDLGKKKVKEMLDKQIRKKESSGKDEVKYIIHCSSDESIKNYGSNRYSKANKISIPKTVKLYYTYSIGIDAKKYNKHKQELDFIDKIIGDGSDYNRSYITENEYNGHKEQEKENGISYKNGRVTYLRLLTSTTCTILDEPKNNYGNINNYINKILETKVEIK